MTRLQRVLDSLVHDWLDNGGVQLLRGRAQGLRHSRNPRLLLTDNVGGTHGELRIKCTWRKPFFINAQATEQAALCGKWQLWEGLGGARLSHALQQGKDLHPIKPNYSSNSETLTGLGPRVLKFARLNSGTPVTFMKRRGVDE